MHIRPLLFVAAIQLFSMRPSAAHAQEPTRMTTRDTSKEDEDLMNMLDEDQKTSEKVKEYTTSVFKTTRLINGHSIENTGKGILDLKISHRFSRIDGGLGEWYGLDGATIRIGFDYGVTNWLTIGVGRSSFQKEYDGYLKARILRQRDDGGMPLSVSYVGAMSASSMKDNLLLGRDLLPGEEFYFSNRLFYTNQLLIARKFSQSISIQLMPSHVHYNLVNTKAEPNDVVAMGVGGRLKLSQRITLNAEYYYQLSGNKLNGTVNSLSVGFDIETGGHVFQLHFTNSTGMTERTFIGQTTDKWSDGGIHFGFNISRVFTVARPRDFKNTRNKIY